MDQQSVKYFKKANGPLMIISAKEPQPMANKYKVRASN
jgi:hypothetical protein